MWDNNGAVFRNARKKFICYKEVQSARQSKVQNII